MPYRKLNKKEKSITSQYLNGLKRSLKRIDGNSFDHYPVKLKDHRLVKLLLCICHDRKLYLPDFVESLLIEQLKKNKSYREYFTQDLGVEVRTQSTLRFFEKPWITTQDERRKGHSEITAS